MSNSNNQNNGNNNNNRNNNSNRNNNNNNNNGENNNDNNRETNVNDVTNPTAQSSVKSYNMYTNACAPITLPCTVGDTYVDPCTCRARLECKVTTTAFIQRYCANGTAWNHLAFYCDSETSVYYGTNGTPICERDKPWTRCSSVLNAYSQDRLKQRCEGGVPTQPTGGPNQASQQSGSDDAGAIAGGVVGGIAALIIIVILVILFKKRLPTKGRKSTLPTLPFRPNLSTTNKEMEENEEVYDVIDEKQIKVPVINEGQLKGSEYDNLAYKPTETSQEEPYNNFNDKTTNFFKSEEPEGYHVLEGSNDPNTLSVHEDLSRSISIGGTDVLIQDSDGYQVGYPSGSVSRQPSPTHPMEEVDLGDSGAGGLGEYDLGRNPSAFYSNSVEYGKTAF